MPESPGVSVVMSVYNPGPKVRKSIESVLSQTFGDFELIILDDASTDGTSAVLEEYARADARIRILATPVNVGLTRNLMRGVSAAQAPYIARLDAGDYWDDDKLRRQREFLETHPEYVLCACQVNYITSGKITGASEFATEDEELRKRLFTRQALLSHPSLFFRNVLNYRAPFRYSQDLDLCARLAFRGKLHCLTERLVFCEVGDSGLTINGKFLQRQYQGHAYRLFLQRFRSGSDELDAHPEAELPVRKSGVEKNLCRVSVLFFRLFIKHKLKKSPRIIWLAFFSASLALYPPFLKDYALRYLLTRRYRNDPWKTAGDRA